MINKEGFAQSTLTLQVAELLDAGIEKIGIVVADGFAELYGNALGELRDRVEFIRQDQPRGFGYAVSLAREFTAGESFLLMVSDHVFVSDDPTRNCVRQILDIAERTDCSVAAVQPTHESEIGQYGTIAGVVEDAQLGMFRIKNIVEKPTPTLAERELLVPGLRSGYYLCFFGFHVLTPRIFDLLANQMQSPQGNGIQLSTALKTLAELETMYALEIRGQRYNLEGRYGLLMAQLAMALGSRHRTEVLEDLIKLIANSRSTNN
ncbi:MAG: UTP--glucose-1-phosphate uridylyltransferase [Verrucomicrobia bacterium]|nr:UTP--glucose-1-phosphate uridylyltransferase [Verrucomicrobiota bacterium]